MLIIDAHLDLAWNALQWNRDLFQTTPTMRANEVMFAGKGRARSTVSIPEMRTGRIAVCFATLLARSTGRVMHHIDYGSHTQAFGIARGQLAYYRALEKLDIARILTDTASLDAHVDEWLAWEADSANAEATPPLGFVISMEGADPITDPEELEEWHQAGLRLIGPSHYGPNRYSGGTGTETGLTEMGPGLLAEVERLGVGLDLTHLSDKSFWQALEIYSGPVLASHNNCRVLVPHQRQFTDDQLKAIFERDGVIGAAFDTWMLEPGWIVGESSNRDITMEAVVDHIDHVCQLAGNAKHAAIGTDLDGGFGNEETPFDLDTIADLQKLPDLLSARGYSSADIEAILHGNWLRFLRRLWGER